MEDGECSGSMNFQKIIFFLFLEKVVIKLLLFYKRNKQPGQKLRVPGRVWTRPDTCRHQFHSHLECFTKCSTCTRAQAPTTF